MTADELERNLTTKEKLATILPALVGVPNPKGKKVWQDFAALKDARDATIHIKSKDANPRVMPTTGIQGQVPKVLYFLQGHAGLRRPPEPAAAAAPPTAAPGRGSGDR